MGLEEALGVHWVAPGVHRTSLEEAPGVHRVESEDAQVLGFGEMVHLQKTQHLRGGWYKNLHRSRVEWGGSEHHCYTSMCHAPQVQLKCPEVWKV